MHVSGLKLSREKPKVVDWVLGPEGALLGSQRCRPGRVKFYRLVCFFLIHLPVRKPSTRHPEEFCCVSYSAVW